jgi:hypothetical protein
MRIPLDPALLFYCSGIRAYEGKTSRKSVAPLKTHFGETWWSENGFHFNRFSEYLNEKPTTAILNWSIAEICTVVMSLFDDIILDGTGIGLTTRGTYRSERYGIPHTEGRSLYARLNLVMDRKFKMVLAAVVTRDHGKGTGEVSQVRSLLQRVRAIGFAPKRVLADALYGNENVLEAIEECGAEPFIPLKSIYTEQRLPKTPLMLALYWRIKADRDAFQAVYDNRPVIEAGIWSIKAKFEGSTRSRTFRAQVNEILFKVLCHNIDVLIHAARENKIDIEGLLGDKLGFMKPAG